MFYFSAILLFCRDYTFRMRKIDVFKCWPFPVDGLTREEIEARLPPMEVPMPSSNRDREEETKNQPKVEDLSPSDDEPPPPLPSPLLPLMGAKPPIDECVGDNLEMVSNLQLLKERLLALRLNVDLEKSDDVTLNLVKEEEEKIEMVCSICKVFKATVVTVMDMHISDCLEKKRREEKQQTRLSSNHNPKRKRRRTLTEIFNLPSQVEVLDKKNVLTEK